MPDWSVQVGSSNVADPDNSVLDWFASDSVADNSLEAEMSLPDELQQSLLVVRPVVWKEIGGRELFTGQFQSDFEWVGGKVVEVLHSTTKIQ